VIIDPSQTEKRVHADPAEIETMIWALVILAILAVAFSIWRGDDGALQIEERNGRTSSKLSGARR
jgi:hypothetical protein